MKKNNNTPEKSLQTTPGAKDIKKISRKNSIKRPYLTSRQSYIELNGNHSVVNMGAVARVWKIDEDVLKLGISYMEGGEFFMSYPTVEWGEHAEGARDEDFTILTMMSSINNTRRDR